MKTNKFLGLIILSVILGLAFFSNFVSAFGVPECSSSIALKDGLCSNLGLPTAGGKCTSCNVRTYCDDYVEGYRTCAKADSSCSFLCLTISTWYLDADNDGFYVSVQNSSTSPGAGWTTTLKSPGDCNDNNAAVNPNATEVCNNIDDNCNILIDENLSRNSLNQLGLCSGNKDSCIAGNWFGFSTNYNPVSEICDFFDNDCDGLVDENNVCGNQTNSTAPLVFISNPVNGFTYNFTNHVLNVNANQVISNWKYSLNNQGNVSFVPGNTFNALNGTNNLVVYGTNANGTGMTSILFYVNTGNNSNNQTNQTNSTIPTLTVFSPVNGRVYNNTNILLNASSNQVVNWIYSLNGINASVANVNQINTFLNALNGTNNLKVFISNVNGSASADLSFLVNTSSNHSGPINAPVIKINTPINNQQYNTSVLTLNVSSNQVVNWIYNINGTNVSAGQSNFLITTFNANNGSNTLRVYGINANGTGMDIVNFVININGDDDDDDDDDDNKKKTSSDPCIKLSPNSPVLNNQTIILGAKETKTLDFKLWLYWLIIAVLVLLIIIIIVYIARSA